MRGPPAADKVLEARAAPPAMHCRTQISFYPTKGSRAGHDGLQRIKCMKFKLQLLPLLHVAAAPRRRPCRSCGRLHRRWRGTVLGCCRRSRAGGLRVPQPQSPSRQMGFFFTMLSDTLWPNRSRMLSMLQVGSGQEGAVGGVRCDSAPQQGWVAPQGQRHEQRWHQPTAHKQASPLAH